MAVDKEARAYRESTHMGDSLEKGTTEGGRIQRLITIFLYTPMKKCLLNHDCRIRERYIL